MATERSNEDGHWDEFRDYCEDNGISLEHRDDWEAWWDCWNAALDAEDNAFLSTIGQDPI